MTTPDASPWAPAARPDLRTFVPRERRVGPLLLWLGCLAGALGLLLWLGNGRLASPDLTAPSTWGAWATELGTAAAVVAGLRILALGLAWYLVGVTAVSVLAHAARAARLVRVADALSFGPVRTVVQQALGVGLAVGVVASALPTGALGRPDAAAATSTASQLSDSDADADARAAADADARRGTAPVPAPGLVATPLEESASAVATGDPSSAAVIGDDGDITVAGTVDSAPTAGAGTARTSGSSTEPDADDDTDAADEVAVGRDAGREVRVRSGDHLWGIAEADLRGHLGREPTEGEVLAHWERVIEVNTDRFVVRSNPDLLRPGQRIALPDVEARP